MRYRIVASSHRRIVACPRRRKRGSLGLVALLVVSALLALAPSLGAGAADETFFEGNAACPIAHCNQHQDGREGTPTGTGPLLDIPVSTQPLITAVAAYTPTPAIAFNSALGCAVGQPAPDGTPDLVACDGTQPSNAGSSRGPFMYDLSATGDASGAGLSLNWASAAYTGTPAYTCTYGSPYAMDGYVVEGAPLFSDYGYPYVSDNLDIAKYTPTGSGGVGTCAWGVPNPAKAAMVSWTPVYLPPSGSYPGDYYVVGQGAAGPLLAAEYMNGSQQVSRSLRDPQGNYYNTYNSISAVETATGARLYVSTAQCPTDGGCGPSTSPRPARSRARPP